MAQHWFITFNDNFLSKLPFQSYIVIQLYCYRLISIESRQADLTQAFQRHAKHSKVGPKGVELWNCEQMANQFVKVVRISFLSTDAGLLPTETIYFIYLGK